MLQTCSPCNRKSVSDPTIYSHVAYWNSQLWLVPLERQRGWRSFVLFKDMEVQSNYYWKCWTVCVGIWLDDTLKSHLTWGCPSSVKNGFWSVQYRLFCLLRTSSFVNLLSSDHTILTEIERSFWHFLQLIAKQHSVYVNMCFI